MDFKTCKCIFNTRINKKPKFSEVVIFRTFKVVVEKVVKSRKGKWSQLLLECDLRLIQWDFNKFQTVLLLLSNLCLFADVSTSPCSVTTFLQQPYMTELCDEFLKDLITLKEWTPLVWRSVHNMSRIVTLSVESQKCLVEYTLHFMEKVPHTYDKVWIKNCSSFCHSVTSAVFTFIEVYQGKANILDGETDYMRILVALVFYFENYELGSTVDKEVLDRVAEYSPTVETSGLSMKWSVNLVDKMVTFLVGTARQDFLCGIGVQLDHAVLSLDFPSSAVQTLATLVILCHLKATTLVHENSSNSIRKRKEDPNSEVRNQATRTGKLNSKVKKVQNALKMQDTVRKKKSPQFRLCEKLYHSGQIRKMYWYLLNKCKNVRVLALEVLVAFEHILHNDKSLHRNAWQSCIIEQGLVPLLELIRCGFPIAISTNDGKIENDIFFPERKIRMYADSLLMTFSSTFLEDISLQEKLILNLIHTQNTCARGNIFSGLIYLSPRNGMIPQVLKRCTKSNDGYTNSIFAEILSEVYVEDNFDELKMVAKIIHHFFESRNRFAEKASGIFKQLDILKQDSRVLKEKVSATAEVFVRNKSDGSLVIMQCPDKKTLKCHSELLVELMETEATERDPNSKHGNLCILPGEYHVWQEIFSHMLDDYVMDTTLVATGVSEILELYEYSCKYELTHLCMRYAKELSNRLSTESFLQIFPGVIKLMQAKSVVQSTTSGINCSNFLRQVYPHQLSLCCHSIRFFVEKVSRLSMPSNPKRKIVITEALDLYFQFLLNTFPYQTS